MVTRDRQWSFLVLAGIAFGTLPLAGCASFAKGDPAAAVPSVPSAMNPSRATNLPSGSRPAVGSGDELEQRGVPAATPEREGAVAQRVPMKSFKAIDWSTRSISQERVGETGSPSVVAGAVDAVGPARLPAFAERRASEALDRLADRSPFAMKSEGPSSRCRATGSWIQGSGRSLPAGNTTSAKSRPDYAIRMAVRYESKGTRTRWAPRPSTTRCRCDVPRPFATF